MVSNKLTATIIDSIHKTEKDKVPPIYTIPVETVDLYKI